MPLPVAEITRHFADHVAKPGAAFDVTAIVSNEAIEAGIKTLEGKILAHLKEVTA
jgi:hypothetical protein